MKLKEIKGVEYYLKNDCYCSNEIYSSDGFFYQLFAPDEDCKLLGETEIYVIVIAKDQMIVFIKETDDKIADATRYDATENNIEIAKLIIDGVKAKDIDRRLDKFPDNNTDRDLAKILSMADAIMIS